MVFPSLGCHTCKRRHKKCDLVQPLCGRCRKGNHLCTWDVNHENGLPFRSENAFAQGRPRRPREPRRHSRVSTSVVMHLHPNIQPAPSFPIDLHSVNYWMENFVFGANDGSDIGLEDGSYIISHWSRTTSDSSLHLALLAFTHAIFGRARRVDDAIEEANRLYCQAVAKVNTDLKNVSNERFDQLLITTMLMGSFENIMRGMTPYKSRRFLSYDEAGFKLCQKVCHYQGTCGLLRLRQARGMPPNQSLDRAVRRQLIRTLILGGKPAPNFLEEQGYDEADFMRVLDHLMLQLANLRAKSISPFQDRNLVEAAQMIANEARDLDCAFETWSKSALETWKSQSMPTSAPLSAPMTGPLHQYPIHTYASPGLAAMWNQIRALRLLVNSVQIHALDTLIQCPVQSSIAKEHQETCRRNIATLSSDLCAGVQFLFNARDVASGNSVACNDEGILPKMAWLLAWPLTIAISTESIPQPQGEWLQSRMRIVAGTLGDVTSISFQSQSSN